MARLSGIGVGMNEWEGRKPAREIEIFNSQAKLSICRKKWMQHLPNLMSPTIYDASVRASLPKSNVWVCLVPRKGVKKSTVTRFSFIW
jgi:hypothetical protein